ncbi:MAG TPA: 3-methyl-2-oxobutanoate hydroxymethyltransferase [Fimbriimonas sp.]|nr:3-methyl-2-oxobutanoate hydroxymethyltransferase [Fimbriimonas sp.]
MADKITAPSLRSMRTANKKIVCITAYDACFGALADEAGADLILVGDSVGNVMLGYTSTVPVTLQEMVHHTRATRQGVKRALLVADLPFGTYESSPSVAMDSAVALMRAGAEAVKLEGDYPEAVAALTKAGIPVMGHLGMTPQSVNRFGGHRVQGKGASSERLLEEAKSLDAAGVFACVLELVPAAVASHITEEVSYPTIGIGAGPCCSGQIQVLHDVLGLGDHVFKHAKPFMTGRQLTIDAIRAYTEEVRASKFPGQEHSS